MTHILQFKITLKHSDPKIWRRFQVEDSLTFNDLHLVIQNVMGWTNSHLSQFKYQKKFTFGDPYLLGRDDIINSRETILSRFFNKPKVSMVYEYDFGDSWDHELLLEKILDIDPKVLYPICLEGEYSCPPEDCGGIYGFYNYLEILKDKKHPEYEDVKEWMGDFKASKFDLEAVNDYLLDFRDIENWE